MALTFSFNSFTGNIIVDFSIVISNCRECNHCYDVLMIGSIPSELGRLSSIVILHMPSNCLNGEFVDKYGGMW